MTLEKTLVSHMETAAEALRRKRLANLRPRPRVKGQPNRITRDLRQAIIDAASTYGSDGQGKGGLPGYCFHLANKHPKAFASLLGKMLPLQVTGDVRNSSIAQINVVTVPSGEFLNADTIARMTAPPALDHEQVEADQDNLFEAAPDQDRFDDLKQHSEAKARGMVIVSSLKSLR